MRLDKNQSYQTLSCYFGVTFFNDTGISLGRHRTPNEREEELPALRTRSITQNSGRPLKIMMNATPIIALAIAGSATATFAEDMVPYAYRPWGPNDPYVPTLGDIMGTTQLRHSKLWFAGKLGNWELASYELGQIRDSLIKAALLYRGIPVDKIVMINEPLSTLDSTIGDKNNEQFMKAFSDLTTKCNVCHDAAGVGFITMRVPTTSPFSNQSFEPKRN